MAEVSVHLFGELLFVYVLLKDACSSHCVDLQRSGFFKLKKKNLKKNDRKITRFVVANKKNKIKLERN